jgi:hypothetical protein
MYHVMRGFGAETGSRRTQNLVGLSEAECQAIKRHQLAIGLGSLLPHIDM